MNCGIKCANTKTCTRTCDLIAGKALANMLSNVDLLDTKVGSVSNDGLLVIGLIEEIASVTPAHVLTMKDVPIPLGGKFNLGKELTAQSALTKFTNYCAEKGMEKGKIADIKKTLYLIEDNKKLIYSIKAKAQIDCLYLNRWISTKVAQVKWSIDPNTGKFNYNIISDTINTNSNACAKYTSEDYGTQFRLNSVEKSFSNASKIDRDVLKLSPYGYFHPVEFNFKKETIAIDGTYIYLVNKELDTCLIIGAWEENKIKVKYEIKWLSGFEKYDTSSKINKIKHDLEYLASHIKYIAPYHITDTVEIDCINREV